MKLEFTEWYQEEFNRMREEPPSEVWENIRSEMDIHDVWSQIDNKLDVKEKKRRISFFFIPAVLAVIVIFGLSIFKLQESEGRILNSASFNNLPEISFVMKKLPKERISVANQTLEVYTEKINERAKRKFYYGHFNNPLNSSRRQKEMVNRTNSSNETDLLINNEAENATEKIVFQFMSPIGASLGFKPDYADFFEPKLLVDTTRNERSKPKSEIYLTVFLNAANSQSVNSITLNGLKQNRLEKTLPYINFSPGFGILYYFNSKYGIQFVTRLFAHNGLVSQYYDEGVHTEESLELQYQYYELTLKNRKLKQLKNFNSGHTLSAGVHYKILNNASRIRSGNSSDVSALYKKTDIGINLNYEFEIYFGKRFSAFSGIGTEIGLRNIRKSTTYEPASFDRTVNTSLFINLGARYLLR